MQFYCDYSGFKSGVKLVEFELDYQHMIILFMILYYDIITVLLRIKMV